MLISLPPPDVGCDPASLICVLQNATVKPGKRPEPTVAVPCPLETVECGSALVPKISTRDVVEMARAQIQMPLPRPRTNPSPKSYVNIRTDLWIQPTLWRAYRAEITISGQHVELTARPLRVVWTPGDGTSEVCYQTTCHHVWTRSSQDPYRVTATVEYNVSWTCEGACDSKGGELGPFPAPGHTRLRVNEIQTVSGGHR